MTVLYLSQNGIAEHIGESQIAPYVLGLAARGYRIHLLTTEKKGREALISEYKQRFDAAGIAWTTIRYHNRPAALGQIRDLVAMTIAALRIARRTQISAIHCRSHPPMFAAILLKKRTNARLLFDFRDFWADSNMAHGRFVPLFRWFKRREKGFLQASDQVVTLTNAAAHHLAVQYPEPGTTPQGKYSVIPCCADFAFFQPMDGAPARARLGVPSQVTTMIYLGSIGATYLLTEMMSLFVELRGMRPDAIFLLVCNNGHEDIRTAATAAGVPQDALRIVHAGRIEVPGLIAAADIAVAFKRADLSNLGCSPIKVGEFLACGIPVIANVGVGDLDSLLSLQINGSLTLPDFTPESMRAGLEQVLSSRLTSEEIRESALALKLESGVDAYAAVYEALGETT